MRALVIFFCLIKCYALTQHSAYLSPSSSDLTEYYSYDAPPEDNVAPLQAARQLANALSPKQQVLFIRTPETNLFTLTAKQLAARNALDVYVLTRQMDAQSLAQQQAALDQAHKPIVHFVKYRTPSDVTRALESIRGSYLQLPGSTTSYAPQTADVIELGTRQLQLQQEQQQQLQLQLPQQQPQQQQQTRRPLMEEIIFKILPRVPQPYEYDNHDQNINVETAQLQALFQYLPLRL